MDIDYKSGKKKNNKYKFYSIFESMYTKKIVFNHIDIVRKIEVCRVHIVDNVNLIIVIVCILFAEIAFFDNIFSR